MSIKKIAAGTAASLTLFGALGAPIASISANAATRNDDSVLINAASNVKSENLNLNNLTDQQFTQLIVQTYQEYRSGQLDVESPYSRIGQTKVAKAIVKFLIKNKGHLFDAIETIGGKEARKIAEKNVSPIMNRLNGLLKREDLMFDTIKQQLEGVLYSIGIPRWVAASVSVVVVEGLRWLA
ncbi:MAG: hypothetical protein LBI43_07090 [Streptococcaceae bacterium]|jgi:cytoplasmic iron level regulating protein YaaA (DUF328/UPF0246 family)|nr:hypothetical protein [Streptococcaceae bacterium]